MSGVLIVGDLLYGFQPLADEVPPAQIKAWKLPQGASLPSILVTRVSRTEQQFLAEQEMRLVTERVQVTVNAASGASREAILKLVRRACAGKLGVIAGFTGVAVLLAGGGPDFMDDAASIFMGSTDLRVSFNEPA
jgi:hypothetical protein